MSSKKTQLSLNAQKEKQAELLLVLNKIKELESGVNKAIEIPLKVITSKSLDKEFYSVSGHIHKNINARSSKIKPISKHKDKETGQQYTREAKEILTRQTCMLYSEENMPITAPFLNRHFKISDEWDKPPPYSEYVEEAMIEGYIDYQHPLGKNIEFNEENTRKIFEGLPTGQPKISQ